MSFVAGNRVIHQNWLGKPQSGTITTVINRFHADVRFDGWDRDVRALLSSLEAPKDANHV